jgi:hypothetical protein
MTVDATGNNEYLRNSHNSERITKEQISGLKAPIYILRGDFSRFWATSDGWKFKIRSPRN